MQCTPEQRQQIDAARAAGKRSLVLEFTPEQRAEWERSRDEATAEKDQVLADLHRMRKAEAEETFSGDLRRAISASRRRPRELAGEIGIDVRLLSDFRCGEASLPSDVIDRLIATLDLRLMREITLSSPSTPAGFAGNL